jgi:hypothetical protein
MSKKSEKVVRVHALERAEAVKTADGKWHLSDVVTKALPCGCKVTGGGICPSPLTVEHCEKHSQVFYNLITACEIVLEAAKAHRWKVNSDESDPLANLRTLVHLAKT